ncbi:unnamed protein product [Closterium sp. Yama58-4]|nr:unnamed protein product [Closterium sp. Yama58-4]
MSNHQSIKQNQSVQQSTQQSTQQSVQHHAVQGDSHDGRNDAPRATARYLGLDRLGHMFRASHLSVHHEEGELFSEHLISSASADRIAFSLDLSLLARALRSSLTTAATRHHLKLVKKSTNPSAPALPFLSLEAKGERSSIVQDMPISAPLPRSQLNELQAGIDLVHSLPQTLVQLPDLPSLRHLVERLQSVGDVADVATMSSGALAMRTHTPSITVATQFKNLRVFGANSESQQSGAGLGEGSRQGGSDDDADISGLSTRLRQMQATGDATVVSVRHLARSLQCYLTRPDASYCEVSKNSRPQPALLVSLQYRLPLLDPG